MPALYHAEALFSHARRKSNQKVVRSGDLRRSHVQKSVPRGSFKPGTIGQVARSSGVFKARNREKKRTIRLFLTRCL
jgi:hypothetical protein